MAEKISRRDFLKLAGALSLASQLPQFLIEPEPSKRAHGSANVLIIVFDAFSARHISLYGYERETSPNIDKFASDSILFKNTIISAPSTLSSHLSILTSRYPSETGFILSDTAGLLKMTRMAKNITPLAQYLKDTGYVTGAITDGGLVASLFGFDRGFDSYLDPFRPRMDVKPQFEKAKTWIEKYQNYNFFLFFHTYGKSLSLPGRS